MNVLRSALAAMLLSALPVPSTAQEDTQGSPFSQAKFVPDISLILDCSYVQRTIRDGSYSALFVPGSRHGDSHEHVHGTTEEGFNLNYAEISFSSIVDPYFELFSVLHVSPDHTHLEEAYFLTRKFPAGFQVKAGKFLSGFGRINEMHEHYWDFSSRALLHTLAFGDEGLNEIGARVSWVAPTESYFTLSAEALMGENEASFGRSGSQDEIAGQIVDAVNGPGLFVGTIKTSVDIGEASILLGGSIARGARRVVDEESVDRGTTTILGGDVTAIYILDAVRYISFQTEYLWRSVSGHTFTLSPGLPPNGSALEERMSGLYFQGVFKFSLRMRAGVRVDLLQELERTERGVWTTYPANLTRTTGMVEFSPTEFSRFRLQYCYDRSRYEHRNSGFSLVPVHEVSLEANLAIGAHGAHAF